MIQSIFFIDGSSGDVVLEKHYKGITSRSSVEVFWERVAKTPKRDDVPPIITTAKYYMVNIYRGGMYVLAVLAGEMPPLFVLEFLHRIYDIFGDYFGEVSVRSLTDNFSTAYQLLEEMLDNGHPMITEPNALNTLIAPPTIASRMANFVLGKASNVSDTLGEGAMSIIPWRRAGVKYAQNEVFFDIIEEVDMILDANGAVVSSDVRGTVACNSRMSGMPDMTLIFTTPGVIDDCAFHPCVRYARWEREQVVSFVPPDGNFTLMTYRVSERAPATPIYCRPLINWRSDSGRVSFVIGPKPMAPGGGGPVRTSTGGISGGPGSAAAAAPGAGGDVNVEDIRLTVSFPPAIKSVDMSCDVGAITVDHRTNDLTWSLPRLPRDKSPELAGTVYVAPGGTQPLESIYATLAYNLPGVTVSGLGVRDLLLVNEGYKFFKGVRCQMRSGRITIRT